MTCSNDHGVDKVLANRGGYTYIMESASVDYEVEEVHRILIISTFLAFQAARNCRLTQVDKMFWPVGYGLALAKGDGDDEYGDQGLTGRVRVGLGNLTRVFRVRYGRVGYESGIGRIWLGIGLNIAIK